MHLPCRQPTLEASQRQRHAREPFMSSMTLPDALTDTWHWLLSVPHLWLYLAAGWVVYLLGLGGWILLQKRPTGATLILLLGLASLPFFGFLVFLVFASPPIH